MAKKSNLEDKPKQLVKVSSTPNTWLELDADLTPAQVKAKVKKFKKLTNTK